MDQDLLPTKPVWLNKLGAPNQYRNMEYVTCEFGQYRCLICGTGDMNRGTSSRHFNSESHARVHGRLQSQNEQYLLALEAQKTTLRRVEDATIMEICSARISYPGWQNAFKLELLDFILGRKPRTEVDLSLSRYVRMEQTSLLELALWKARIYDQQMRVYEPGFDVGAFARQMRVLCGSEAIIPLVLEYLGPMMEQEQMIDVSFM